MRSRRFFALLSAVTMLHLTVASGDPACATHGASEQHAPIAREMATERAMPIHGHVMPSAHESPTAGTAETLVASSDTAPCEIPARRNCCEALVGCSVAAAITSARHLLTADARPTARVRELLHRAPASFASAPEPPPPKA